MMHKINFTQPLIISYLNSDPGSFLDFLDFFFSSGPSGTIVKVSFSCPILGVPGGDDVASPVM